MSGGAKSAGPALAVMLVVLAGLCIALIAMGNYAVGIALLAVVAALAPTAWKAAKGRAGGDDGAGQA